MNQYNRQPAAFTEYQDNRTAAEIRRDMALLRIHTRYGKRVAPTVPVTKIGSALAALAVLGWLFS